MLFLISVNKCRIDFRLLLIETFKNNIVSEVVDLVGKGGGYLGLKTWLFF